MLNKPEIHRPRGGDPVANGDDAITANANALSTLWDRALKVATYSEFPSGPVTSWYGTAAEGIYRAPSQQVVDGLAGVPQGAGPGLVTVVAVGSTTSQITWEEFGDLGRSWRMTASSSSAYASGWQLIPGSKRVATSLTLGRANDVRTATEVAHALPLTLGARAHRWRLHVRNTNDRTTNTVQGVLSYAPVRIGKMQRTAAGEATAAVVPGTLQTVAPASTSPETGNELATPWVEDFPLEPGTDYVIRYGFTAGEGQEINYLEGGGWSLDAGVSALSSASPAATLSARAPLDVWIELEVDASTPCFAYFGDSLTAGQEATLPVYDSWPARHARAHGAIPTFFAHAGARMSEWTNPAHIKFRKYQLPGYSITRADRLYWSMGSNDLFAEDKSVEDMLAAMAVTFPLITAVTSRNVIMTTVLPRHDAEDPQEPVRREWNEYIQRNLPHGTLMVLDAAAALTAPDGDQLDTTWSSTPTNIHLSSAGYARFAAQVH